MLPEKVTKLIGTAGDVSIVEVERGAIKRYIDAVGDYNPLYWNEEYARESRYGSIIAPPSFFGWPVRPTPTSVGAFTDWPVKPGAEPEKEGLWDTIAEAGYSRVVHGGVEAEHFAPVRAGDILAVLTKVADIFEREGKTGKMAFSVTETTYTNQRGELVAKVRNTMVHRFRL